MLFCLLACLNLVSLCWNDTEFVNLVETRRTDDHTFMKLGVATYCSYLWEATISYIHSTSASFPANTGGSLYKYLTESHIHDWRIPKIGNLNLTKTTNSFIFSHLHQIIYLWFLHQKSLQKTSFFSKFHPFFIWRKTTFSFQSRPNHQALVHEAVSFRSPPRSVLAARL